MRKNRVFHRDLNWPRKGTSFCMNTTWKFYQSKSVIKIFPLIQLTVDKGCNTAKKKQQTTEAHNRDYAELREFFSGNKHLQSWFCRMFQKETMLQKCDWRRPCWNEEFCHLWWRNQKLLLNCIDNIDGEKVFISIDICGGPYSFRVKCRQGLQRTRIRWLTGTEARPE